MRSLLTLLVLGHIASAQPATTGTVSGRVIENGTRVAEFGVAVSDMPNASALPRVVSAPDGRFTIYGVPPGTHVVRLLGWSFVEQLLVVDVTAGQPTDVGSIEVLPGTHAEGSVTDATGQPVRNATVMVFGGATPALAPVWELMSHGVRAAVTDENGHYVIDGIEGAQLQMLALTVAIADNDAMSSGTTTYDPRMAMVDLVMRDTGELAGLVVKAPNTTVTATYATDDDIVVTAQTDKDGYFSLSNLPIGAWNLTTEAILAPVRAEVAVGQQTLAKWKLPDRRASVTFVGGECSMMTILGARMYEKEIGTELATETCENDRATFRHLAPGRYRVCVDGEGECSEWSLKAGGQTVKLPVSLPRETPWDL